jgi:hypothetical protein
MCRPEQVHECALHALMERVLTAGKQLDLAASLSRFLHRKGKEHAAWRQCIDKVLAAVQENIKQRWGCYLDLS